MEKELLIKTVTAAQNGDSDAMNKLFNESYNDCYYFALKTVKDEQLACDITQNSMIIILKTLKMLQEPAAYFAWMKKIVYNKCRDYFKKKTDVLVEEDEDGNTIFDTVKEDNTEFIPEEALNQDEFKKTILSMIDELSEEQRAVVLMYYFDEMSVSQIAEVEGCSVGTVKSRLNYARKAIKKSVDEYEKKHDVKLHAVPFFPLLCWILGKGGQSGAQNSLPTMPLSVANTMAANVSAQTGISVSITAAGAVVKTAAAAATATVKVGFVAKVAALPLAAKLTAGIVAVAVLVTSVAVPVSLQKNARNSEGTMNDNVTDESTITGDTTALEENLSDEDLYQKAWDIINFTDFDGTPAIEDAMEFVTGELTPAKVPDTENQFMYPYLDVELLLTQYFVFDTSNLKTATIEITHPVGTDIVYYDASSDCFIYEYNSAGGFGGEYCPIEYKNTSVTQNEDGTVTVVVECCHTDTGLSDIYTVKMKVNGKTVTYLSKSEKSVQEGQSNLDEPSDAVIENDILRLVCYLSDSIICVNSSVSATSGFSSTDELSNKDAMIFTYCFSNFSQHPWVESGDQTYTEIKTIPASEFSEKMQILLGRTVDYASLAGTDICVGLGCNIQYNSESQAIVATQFGVGGGGYDTYKIESYQTTNDADYDITIGFYKYEDDYTVCHATLIFHVRKVSDGWQLISLINA